jgi:hypothetical protein
MDADPVISLRVSGAVAPRLGEQLYALIEAANGLGQAASRGA